jgi:hypothetical protein
MSRDINPFGLRMQPDLRGALELSAELKGRSLNAEITYRLARSLAAESPNAAKRELAIKELRDAAVQVVLFSEIADRNEMDEKLLKDALDDLGLWLRQLEKLDKQES